MIKQIRTSIRGLLPRTRTSNPISKLLRPLMEKRRVLPNAMMTVMAIVTTMSLVIPSTHAFAYSIPQEKIMLDASEVTEITTKSSYIFPAPESAGISQGYHGLHRGLDIRARKGSPVLSVASGVVIQVTEMSFGYGKHIRIAHAGTVSSLYAHLDEIKVGVGQRVERGQEIGTVGSTGWSTGNHLHFELSEAMSSVNPKSIL